MSSVLTIEDKGLSGTITLENGIITINFLGEELSYTSPAAITELLKVNEFVIEIGYVAVETNWGEEYIDIEYLFEINNLKYTETYKIEYSKSNTG